MIVQADVDKAVGDLGGNNLENLSPYDPAFVEFVRVQTQLMLEMRDTLNEISELSRNQLITQNSIWEKLHS